MEQKYRIRASTFCLETKNSQNKKNVSSNILPKNDYNTPKIFSLKTEMPRLLAIDDSPVNSFVFELDSTKYPKVQRTKQLSIETDCSQDFKIQNFNYLRQNKENLEEKTLSIDYGHDDKENNPLLQNTQNNSKSKYVSFRKGHTNSLSNHNKTDDMHKPKPFNQKSLNLKNQSIISGGRLKFEKFNLEHIVQDICDENGQYAASPSSKKRKNCINEVPTFQTGGKNWSKFQTSLNFDNESQSSTMHSGRSDHNSAFSDSCFGLSKSFNFRSFHIDKNESLCETKENNIKIENLFISMPELLSKILQYLSVSDLFALIQINKGISNHKRRFELQFKTLKIRGLLSSELRENYWMNITGANEIKKFYGDAYYTKLLSIDSPWEKDIIKDIDRTFIHNNQQNLFHLLKAFSNHIPTLGYCQGMNFIAATLLIILKDINAFYILISLMEKYKLKHIFNAQGNELNIYKQTFDLLLAVMHPELYEYINSLEIESTDYITPWFNTLFSYSWNYNFVIRFWDIFLKDGWKFLYKVGLTILKINKEKIFKMNPDNILTFLKNFTRDVSFNEEKLLQEANEIKLTNRLIQEISSILSSGKCIKKLHLYYDPKIGKKNWRYEFYGTSTPDGNIKDSLIADHNKNICDSYHSMKQSQTSSSSSPGIFSSFIQKIKLTFNGNKPEDYVINTCFQKIYLFRLINRILTPKMQKIQFGAQKKLIFLI